MSKKIDANEAANKTFGQKAFDIYDKYGMLLVLIGLGILISILNPMFLRPLNLINIIRQMSFVSMIAVGSMMIIVIRGIDLAPGSVLALSAVVVADLTSNSGWNPILAILVALLAATFSGFVSGSIIAKTGIPPFIATLGMMTAVRGAALLYTNGKPVPIKDDVVIWMGGGTIGPIPVPIVLLILVVVITYIMLNYTKLGRHIYAMGGNEEAAIISGVDVVKLKIFVYSVGGFLAGLSGISLAGRIQSGQPGMGLSYELDAIAAAVIGGTSQAVGGIGTAQGTIVGALIIGVINNGMNLMNINSYWQQIVKGAIIITAVVLDMQKAKRGK